MQPLNSFLAEDIVIVNYNAGNSVSIQNALLRIGYPSKISSNPNVLDDAKIVILPGVGNFETTIEYLYSHGLDKKIISLINSNKKFLGICLGMQILTSFSEEGNKNGLSIFPSKTKQLSQAIFPKNPNFGWHYSSISNHSELKVFESKKFYFAHSYFVEKETNKYEKGLLLNNPKIVTIIEKANFLGVQFHPEKSNYNGLEFFKFFIEKWNPKIE